MNPNLEQRLAEIEARVCASRKPWSLNLRSFLRDAREDIPFLISELRKVWLLAEIGAKWRRDSSLETWFPFSAEELSGLKIELQETKAALFCPGVSVCDKCGFTQFSNLLSARTGDILANLARPGLCPNDGEQMRQVTWKERAVDIGKCAEQQVERAVKAEQERDDLEAQCQAMRDVLNACCDKRAVELAKRLVAPGEKAHHVSCSETHEISEHILGLNERARQALGKETK